jgi:type II secretory pathway pseudopilin PulG
MKKNEAGFSYADTMVGVTIMTIGLLGLAGTIGASVVRSRQQEQQLRAKQYAISTMESVMSARDINANGLQNGWDSIGNIGSNVVNGTPRGVFLSGEQPLRENAGPDEEVGTSDDSGVSLNGMTREIIITDVCDPERPSPGCSPAGTNPIMARKITVKIRYPANPLGGVTANATKLNETVSTVLTKF